MSFLSRLLTPPPPPLAELWRAITETARQPRWYLRYAVADTVDGRFDMVALVTALVMLRLEALGRIADTSSLTERFVDDMDGSLRDIGIGDMVIGKHMGRVMGAMGGRLGAYRVALAPGADPALLPEALARNVYRSEDASGPAADLAPEVRALKSRIDSLSPDELLSGALR